MTRRVRMFGSTVAMILWVSGSASAYSLDCLPLFQGTSASHGTMTVTLSSDLTLSGQTTDPATTGVAFFLFDCATPSIIAQFLVILPIVGGSFSIGLAALGDATPFEAEPITIASLIASGSFAVYIDPRYGSTSGDGFPVLLQFGTLTPAQTIQSLADHVETLVSSGALNAGQRDALTAKLDAALQQLNGGNDRAARNQLSAFVNQVRALVRAGILTDAQADALINPAEVVINAL